ncbi:MAG: hypothetical protein BECKG1743F_GA0114225_103873 [Candidatus Kentron sp. G]|nr:MAG: hypothetical protein BECKG1743F_GA0114225_103873 [Candidatus Kentron sp. G]
MLRQALDTGPSRWISNNDYYRKSSGMAPYPVDLSAMPEHFR